MAGKAGRPAGIRRGNIAAAIEVAEVLCAQIDGTSQQQTRLSCVWAASGECAPLEDFHQYGNIKKTESSQHRPHKDSQLSCQDGVWTPPTEWMHP